MLLRFDALTAMTPLSSVLIVDDEPAVRDLMSRWVASLGLRPQTASNADEALASMRVRHYDLAVIDVMMPGRDGLWLAAQLGREHPQTAVIVATASVPIMALNTAVMFIMIFFPGVVLFLPSLAAVR